MEARGGRATEEVGEAESAQVQNGAKQGEEKEGGCGRSGRCGMAQWDGGALPSPECRETYKGRPEDAQRTLRGRSEALRGRSEGAQRRAESLRGRPGAALVLVWLFPRVEESLGPDLQIRLQDCSFQRQLRVVKNL